MRTVDDFLTNSVSIASVALCATLCTSAGIVLKKPPKARVIICAGQVPAWELGIGGEALCMAKLLLQ